MAKKYNNERLQALSALVSRASLFSGLGQTYGGDRNVYDALGYKQAITYQDYYNKYKRQALARRVVKAPVDASWRKKPVINEVQDNDDGKQTAFEKEWIDFQKEHKVYHYLKRTDQLAGIGRYAVLLLGFGDGLPLSQEALPNQKELIYLRPYTEGNSTVDKWELDTQNPRYGKPLLYSIQTSIDDSAHNVSHTIKVHHSRIIHITDDAEENDVYGTPRLEDVYRRMMFMVLPALRMFITTLITLNCLQADQQKCSGVVLFQGIALKPIQKPIWIRQTHKILKMKSKSTCMV